MSNLKEANFSLWCDFIERDFLESQFPKLLENPLINGATSNPAIFKDAFSKSEAYKNDIKTLQNKNPKEIYEELATKDIQIAANILKPLYEKGDDGFISIEIDPLLCDDFEGSLNEALRLYNKIDRENVMIKVPATKAGYLVMRELFSKGINVNATLIFSPTQAIKCLDAFESGIENFKKLSSHKKAPSGVISIFVSRFDRKVNPMLDHTNLSKNLLGIYNATNIYNIIQKRELKEVRALFASTGVKGDDLKTSYYIDELLYENAINTAPIKTINAFLEEDINKIKEPISQKIIDEFLISLKNVDIDLNNIYQELMDEGLKAFKVAFNEILKQFEKG